MAKKKPQVDQKTTITSWEEADEQLANIGVLNQEIKKIEGEMNIKITEIQNKYQPKLAELTGEKIGLERDLQLYCEEHRSEFDEKKTMELSFGTVSFRWGTGALKTLQGWTWQSVENVIAKSRSLNDRFLIKKTILAKDLLKSELSDKELLKIGCYVHQKENFYYECFERRYN